MLGFLVDMSQMNLLMKFGKAQIAYKVGKMSSQSRRNLVVGCTVKSMWLILGVQFAYGGHVDICKKRSNLSKTPISRLPNPV